MRRYWVFENRGSGHVSVMASMLGWATLMMLRRRAAPVLWLPDGPRTHVSTAAVEEFGVGLPFGLRWQAGPHTRGSAAAAMVLGDGLLLSLQRGAPPVGG